MDVVLRPIGRALFEAYAMFWEVLWPLILGFALSWAVAHGSGEHAGHIAGPVHARETHDDPARDTPPGSSPRAHDHVDHGGARVRTGGARGRQRSHGARPALRPR